MDFLSKSGSVKKNLSQTLAFWLMPAIPPCHIYDPVDVFQCVVQTYNTEGDLVLMDTEVTIHELLVNLCICLLQGLHLKLQVLRNQPGIFLFVI